MTTSMTAVPVTRGHTEAGIGKGKGTMELDIEEMIASGKALKPQIFRMAIQLPKSGRAAALLGATDRMWVNLKAYAEGGENVLHAHTNEDHTFIILAGRATFTGPNGEKSTLGRNEGIMLPRGSLYYFHAEPGEPLVILRMGCVIDPARDAWERKGKDGRDVPANSETNKTTKTVFYEDRVYE
jgi:mannose-6-phosphate isomerase-like protein (cupin superfamily)